MILNLSQPRDSEFEFDSTKSQLNLIQNEVIVKSLLHCPTEPTDWATWGYVNHGTLQLNQQSWHHHYYYA